MENLKSRCIKSLMENYSNVIKTEVEADIVFEKIKEVIVGVYLEEFIKEDLCVFSNKNDALNWFSDGEEDIIKLLKTLDIKATADMIGKSLGDIIEAEILKGKENYIMVNDNIHLTYWM